ncbi:MAG: hypothetical protein IT342_15435 [Candidatus Melainabacteria bacterium]|nr:hypothetical protein [Candidatus Melainabacteria bacterium]
MTENKNSADLLDLLLQSLTGQTVVASFAHRLLALDDVRQNHASCTQPEELSRLAAQLALSARETAANTSPAHSVRGRQLDYLHAQSGALVHLTERYITQVRQRRDVLEQTQQARAVGYTDAEAGLRAENAAHQLAASVVALESFILAVRSVAHQSVAVVTRVMAVAH